MGAHPYWYVVQHEADINAALQKLRQREFEAGRYNPVMPFINFPLSENAPAPGRQHDSMEEAMEDADADGTRSILDIMSVGAAPDFCVAAPLPDDVLSGLYGTPRPTRAMVEGNLAFLDDLDRGHAVYVVLYRDDQPDEILFAGYSFD